jgi:lipopolysaccharide transport system permease protein
MVNRAPGLILSNPNFVKKVIFPLELLPLVSMGSVLFHGGISLLVLLIAQLFLKGGLPLTVIYLPLVLLPLLVMALGISWFLSALTVYIRDIVHVTGIVTSVLMFVSAVFFPISALPSQYAFVIRLNPVALIVSESRNALVFGISPDWGMLAFHFLLGLLTAVAGYWWFQKTRKGFADVL